MLIRMTTDVIDTAEVLKSVEDPACGAVDLFLGVVRNHSGGQPVEYLEYEAYPPMAEQLMRDLGHDVLRRFPVKHVAMVHRIGRLDVGDVSVAIAVSSHHRKAAFEACRYCIDTLKQTVPIWKKEVGPDGHSWIEGTDRVCVHDDQVSVTRTLAEVHEASVPSHE